MRYWEMSNGFNFLLKVDKDEASLICDEKEFPHKLI